MKTLLAADGSVYTQRALDYFAAHPELLGSNREFTVLTVVASVPPHITNYISRTDLQTYYDDQAEDVLKPLRAMAEKHQWNANFITKVGQVADVIASTAQEGGFDMVVMGSHGRSALNSLVLGSVAARVLASCTTPLLIVR